MIVTKVRLSNLDQVSQRQWRFKGYCLLDGLLAQSIQSNSVRKTGTSALDSFCVCHSEP